MNLPYFISSRISGNVKGSFSYIISRIAVVSIAIAVGALLMAFMILLGFQNKIKDKIYSFSGHLLVGKYTLTNSFEESSFLLDEELKGQLETTPGIAHFQSFAMRAGLLQIDGEIQGVVIKGLDHRQDSSAFYKQLVDGRMPDLSSKNYTTEVVLSKKISNALQMSVGDEVLILFIQNPPRYRKLKIVGIYETGLEEFDQSIVYGDLRMIRRINGWAENEVGGVEIFVQDLATIDEIHERLFDTLGFDLFVEKVSDRYLQIFDWLALLNRNVVIFLVLILFVAGFSMVSILLILIMERTQMVGMLKALGASNQLIRRVFLANGVRLVFRGLAWGNAVALGLGLMQYYGRVIPMDAASYYMDHVPIQFDLTAILAVNALVILLIGASLFIPLNVISRIQPIRSIRFD